jgi:hypothetical protein
MPISIIVEEASSGRDGTRSGPDLRSSGYITPGVPWETA